MCSSTPFPRSRICVVVLLIGLLFASVPISAVRAAGVIYVDADAAGLNNGSTWANAFSTLQSALAFAQSGDEIWLADGIYYPDEGDGQIDNDRNSTFTLKSGIALYGGFAGSEANRDQRDPLLNLTVLSGDLDRNDLRAGSVLSDTTHITGSNSYHVVTASGTDATAVLDGVTITAGLADDEAGYLNTERNKGGGLYNAGGNPTLRNLVFRSNKAIAIGGGMYNAGGSPTLTNVRFIGNRAYDERPVHSAAGGGMMNDLGSQPTLSNVIFEANTSEVIGGGMYNARESHATLEGVIFHANSAGATGGGMSNGSSNVTLVDVTFSENSASSGGGMANSGGTISLSNVIFEANRATWGGGMSNQEYSDVVVQNALFQANSAQQDGGGIRNQYNNLTLTNVTFQANTANNGGGMAAQEYEIPTRVRLSNVRFSDNTAVRSGGGYRNDGVDSILSDVTFSGNSADQGGGLFNSGIELKAVNTTFSNNSATKGGGMLVVSDFEALLLSDHKLELYNLTFSGNQATSGGGLFYGDYRALEPQTIRSDKNSTDNRAGVSSTDYSPTILQNSTFYANSADSGGGVFIATDENKLMFTNVIIAGSSSGGDCVGIPAQVDYSLIEDASAACGLADGVNNNIVGVDPLLGPLADNGGFSLTHALLPGSAAIDSGTNVDCPSSDQRGVTRPQGIRCDIGAVEFTDTNTPTVSSIVRVGTSPSNAGIVSFVVTFTEPVSGIDSNDFELHSTGELSGAIISEVVGSGALYTVTVETGSGDGNLRLDIPATATISDSFENALGGLPYTNGEVYRIDKTAPSVTVEQAADQPDPVGGGPIRFVVEFSEPVVNFSADSVTLLGTAAADTVVITGSGTNYIVSVSGMNGPGTVIVRIAAGALQDPAGNANLASNSTDNSVEYGPAATQHVIFLPLMLSATGSGG